MHELDRLPRLLLRLEGAALLAAPLAVDVHEGVGLAHIGVDRRLGYPSGFEDTHLQRV